MKTPALIGLIFFCLQLSGCVADTVMAYEGDERPLSEVAILTTDPNSQFFVGLASYVEAGTGEDFEHVGGVFAGYPSEMHMLPGEYAVLIYCGEGDWFSWPQFRFTAVAGMSWKVGCRSVPGQSGKVEAVLTPLP